MKSLEGTPWEAELAARVADRAAAVIDMTEAELAAAVIDMEDAPGLDKRIAEHSKEIERERAALRRAVKKWIRDEGRPRCNEKNRDEMADIICSAVITPMTQSRNRQAGWKLYATNDWKRALRRTRGKIDKWGGTKLTPEGFSPSERPLAGMALTRARRGDALDVAKAQQERKRLARSVFDILSAAKGGPIVSRPVLYPVAPLATDARADADARANAAAEAAGSAARAADAAGEAAAGEAGAADEPQKRYCPAAATLMAIWAMAGLPSKGGTEYAARLLHEVKPTKRRKGRRQG